MKIKFYRVNFILFIIEFIKFNFYYFILNLNYAIEFCLNI